MLLYANTPTYYVIVGLEKADCYCEACLMLHIKQLAKGINPLLNPCLTALRCKFGFWSSPFFARTKDI